MRPPEASRDSRHGSRVLGYVQADRRDEAGVHGCVAQPGRCAFALGRRRPRRMCAMIRRVVARTIRGLPSEWSRRVTTRQPLAGAALPLGSSGCRWRVDGPPKQPVGLRAAAPTQQAVRNAGGSELRRLCGGSPGPPITPRGAWNQTRDLAERMLDGCDDVEPRRGPPCAALRAVRRAGLSLAALSSGRRVRTQWPPGSWRSCHTIRR